MRKVSKHRYEGMYKDYKGEYMDYHGTNPELKGRKTFIELEKETQATVLRIEGVDFEIVDEIQVGDVFRINTSICEDGDLLDWYEGQLLRAESVEYDVNGIWVKDCPYRIDMGEIEI